MKNYNWSERVHTNWQTKKAYENYCDNPNTCLHCGSCIWPIPRSNGIVQANLQKYCRLACASEAGSKRRAETHTGVKVGGKYMKRCELCGDPMTRHATTCRSCRWDKEREEFRKKTIGELRRGHKGGRPHTRSLISKVARRVFNATEKDRKCAICDYSTFVDVAHIRPVHDFPETATLLEVNAPENLIGLCPNHHWEFDNGILELKEKEPTAT